MANTLNMHGGELWAWTNLKRFLTIWRIWVKSKKSSSELGPIWKYFWQFDQFGLTKTYCLGLGTIWKDSARYSNSNLRYNFSCGWLVPIWIVFFLQFQEFGLNLNKSSSELGPVWNDCCQVQGFELGPISSSDWSLVSIGPFVTDF